ncbi:metal-dependent hydrolase [Haloarcula sp. JP-L23]|uniref:metal-dependent hydrolase n=1 Tax=Haloarcula sp. JP-L23 TaxID=2716717 RepID=UPI00140EB13D|nr:metal-dependent hydrolase [Haloarcula sp. JP-L23]
MADLLTHVLVGFILGSILAVGFRWKAPPFVAVVMVGALLPDLAKIAMILPPRVVEETLGIPFDWFAVHTPFGTLLVAGIGSLLVSETIRRRVFVLLLIGGASHLVLDSLLISPSRFYHVLFWPLTTQFVSLPGLYLSSDRWPSIVAACLAVVAWFVRWQNGRE